MGEQVAAALKKVNTRKGFTYIAKEILHCTLKTEYRTEDSNENCELLETCGRQACL